MEQYLRVGVISSTHGVRGEVKVYPTTDDPARFKKLKKVILDMGREQRELAIESNDVEMYRGMDLLITRDQAVRLAPNENFIVDLIGLKAVTDDGKELGVLKDVMLTGANDVYVIETGEKKEILIPAIPDCVLDVNLEEGTILIHLLDGLLDL